MAKTFISLVIVFILTPFTDARRSHLDAPANLDFFYLAMQWPPATCNMPSSNCKTPIKSDNFTLHGLWPSSTRTPCQTKKFDINKLKKAGIITNLNKYWPNLLVTPNEVFWEHEWKEHGKCSPWNLVDYFKNSIKIVESVNLLQILESSGIKPNDQQYKIVDIKNAFKAHHLEPLIKCNQLKNHDELHEIRLCVNKIGLHFEKCQRTADFYCSKQIIFPSPQSAYPSPPPKVVPKTPPPSPKHLDAPVEWNAQY